MGPRNGLPRSEPKASEGGPREGWVRMPAPISQLGKARGMRRQILTGWLAAAGAAGLLCASSAFADAVEDAPEVGAALTGRDIYQRVIDNRFRSFSQNSRLISADRAGREQETRILMHWKDYRDDAGNPTRGVLSKTLVKYTHPYDIRYSGYLIQVNDGRMNDQFVYYPSKRKILRVNLRSEAVYGTDFSFEDVVPREIDKYGYKRLDDEVIDDFAVQVVELKPLDTTNSEYSRIRVYVDEERYVVLRALYWDGAGVAVKELSALPSEVREFDGVWVPMYTTMRNLLMESHTRLIVTDLIPNPELSQSTFDLGHLESH